MISLILYDRYLITQQNKMNLYYLYGEKLFRDYKIDSELKCDTIGLRDISIF